MLSFDYVPKIVPNVMWLNTKLLSRENFLTIVFSRSSVVTKKITTE